MVVARVLGEREWSYFLVGTSHQFGVMEKILNMDGGKYNAVKILNATKQYIFKNS